MRNDFETNYLAHHGILGQKWGHRNGPPYPLDAKDHSSSEKKAGYKKSIGGGRNEEYYGKKTKFQNSDGSLTRKATKKLLKSAKYDAQKDDIKKFSKMSAKEFNKELKRTEEVQKKTMKDSFSKSRSRVEHIAKMELAEQSFNDHAKMLVYQKAVDDLLNKYGMRRLEQISEETKEFKNAFYDWIDAHEQWQKDTGNDKLAEKETDADNKQFYSYINLHKKGYSEKELGKLMDEALEDYKRKK